MRGLDMNEANKNIDWYLESKEYGYPNVTGANKGVILEIRRERTVELIQEGFRLQDLYRWKAGYCIDQAISGMYVFYHKTVENQRPGFKEERDYLYPIPSGERSLNPNLTQNPGWSDGLDF